MIEALFFYMFSAVMLGAGLMVVVSRNPVFSVLFLILACETIVRFHIKVDFGFNGSEINGQRY